MPGSYFLGVDFGGSPVQLATYAAGTLTAAAPLGVSTVHVGEAQVLHLVLDLTGNAASATAGVRVTVFDSAGRVVDSRFAPAGDAASLNVSLPPGDYRVLVAAGTTDGSALPALRFAIRGLTLSDPIGPQPVDPTTTGTTSGSTGTTTPPIDWTSTTYSGPVTPVDPTSAVWWIAPPTDWTSIDWAAVSPLLTP